MSVAAAYITSGRYKRILLIGADKMSSIIDYEDRKNCVLFGANGFIGSHVAEVLSNLGHNVTIADLKKNSSLSNKIESWLIKIGKPNGSESEKTFTIPSIFPFIKCGIRL